MLRTSNLAIDSSTSEAHSFAECEKHPRTQCHCLSMVSDAHWSLHFVIKFYVKASKEVFPEDQ